MEQAEAGPQVKGLTENTIKKETCTRGWQQEQITTSSNKNKQQAWRQRQEPGRGQKRPWGGDDDDSHEPTENLTKRKRTPAKGSKNKVR